MADWSLPTVTDLYTNIITYFKNRDTDLALMFDGTTPTNLPTNAIGWNSANSRFEKWSGSAWAALDSSYEINVTELGGQAAANYILKATTTTAGFAFVIDEDSMASNLATKVPTQQSVKAFVESAPAMTGELAVTASGGSDVAIEGLATNTAAGTNYGVKGTAKQENGYGVYGLSDTTTTSSNGGRGVFGISSNAKYGVGVYGSSVGDSGSGVRGLNSNSTSTGSQYYGGYFTALSGSYGVGVRGHGSKYGGYFEMGTVVDGKACWGFSNSNTTGLTYGGYFQSRGTTGIGCYAAAIRTGAYTNYGGYFEHSGDNGYGCYADSFSPFTGVHEGLASKAGFNVEIGDIIVDVSVVGTRGISDAICENEVSTVPNQKSAVGVYSGKAIKLADFEPVESDKKNDKGKKVKTKNERIGIPFALQDMTETEYNSVQDTYNHIHFNSLGEGLVNVCGEGGDIEIGDLIVTSSIAGKGMKQADEFVRNYTVAKSRENVTFNSGTEVKQIACIYLCG